MDASGASYITGAFRNTLNIVLANGTTITLTGDPENEDNSVLVMKLDLVGTAVWATGFRGTGSATSLDIAMDTSGALYITGDFRSTLDVPLANGTTVTLTSAGSFDVFVIKLDSTGGALWARRFGGTDGESGRGIAVDASGASYITGQFSGTMDIVLVNGTTATLTSADSADIFMIKVDASGGALWARGFGGIGVQDSQAIAVDASGASYTTGLFHETMNLVLVDGSTVTLTSFSGGAAVFVIKLDSTGGAVWAQDFGGGYDGRGNAIALDASGSIFITGGGAGEVVLANGTTVTLIDGAFVMKLDSTGGAMWAQSIGDTYGTGIAVDASGASLHITGEYYSALDIVLTTGITVTLPSLGNDNVYVMGLDSTGAAVWAQGLAGTGDMRESRIAVDTSGASFITGGFRGTLDVVVASGSTVKLTSAGGFDIYVMAFDLEAVSAT